MSLVTALLLFLAAGALGGVLLGMIGVGMALIAVPLLMLALPSFAIDPSIAALTALATSMAVVSVGSISSVASHHRLGNVDGALVRTIVPASVVGVLFGTLVAGWLPGSAIRWIFCAFLLVIALRMLLPGGQHAPAAGRPTSPTAYRATGALIGVAGALIGAGGGVFMVPFLGNRGHPMRRAVATSTAIGLPVSVIGAVSYALQTPPVPAPAMAGYVFLPAFAGLGLGSLLGAPLGAVLASKAPADLLRRGFALVLAILAVTLPFG